jgi:hypothetical protein
MGASATNASPAPDAAAPQKTVGTQPCPVQSPSGHHRLNWLTDSWLAATQTAPTPSWFTAEAYPLNNALSSSARAGGVGFAGQFRPPAISPLHPAHACSCPERSRRPNQASGSEPNPLPGSPVRPRFTSVSFLLPSQTPRSSASARPSARKLDAAHHRRIRSRHSVKRSRALRGRNPARDSRADGAPKARAPLLLGRRGSLLWSPALRTPEPCLRKSWGLGQSPKAVASAHRFCRRTIFFNQKPSSNRNRPDPS